MKKLVGCIEEIKAFGLIKTRFFYVDIENEEIKDVTLELCQAIDDFNKVAHDKKAKGEYSIVIPYKYKEGLAQYSHGSGLSSYLTEYLFPVIVERSTKELSFPLAECGMHLFTKYDIEQILKCESVWDNSKLEKEIISYFQEALIS